MTSLIALAIAVSAATTAFLLLVLHAAREDEPHISDDFPSEPGRRT